MKNTILALSLSLFLAACAQTTPTLISTKLRVVQPPESLYKCDVTSIKNIDPNNLTDKVVAKLLVQFHKDNMTCHDSIEAIREYLKKAELRLEQN